MLASGASHPAADSVPGFGGVLGPEVSDSGCSHRSRLVSGPQRAAHRQGFQEGPGAPLVLGSSPGCHHVWKGPSAAGWGDRGSREGDGVPQTSRGPRPS